MAARYPDLYEGLYDRVFVYMRGTGFEDSIERGQYFIHDDDWGDFRLRIFIDDLRLLAPPTIHGLKDLLADFPRYEILAVVTVPDTDWPPMGLRIRHDMIFDGLHRDVLPEPAKSYRYHPSEVEIIPPPPPEEPAVTALKERVRRLVEPLAAAQGLDCHVVNDLQDDHRFIMVATSAPAILKPSVIADLQAAVRAVPGAVIAIAFDWRFDPDWPKMKLALNGTEVLDAMQWDRLPPDCRFIYPNRRRVPDEV